MTAHTQITAADIPQSRARRSAPGITDAAWVTGALLAVFALQFTMLFTRAINWDEFYHYSLVEDFVRGSLTQPLQTFFVRPFQWLVKLPGTVVDHIVAARIAMFACEAVAAGAVAKLAIRFTDRATGLLCALAYVTVGFVLQHGFSFRFDPVDAALLMSALCVLACTSFRGAWRFLFAALVALAGVYTMKSVLYAPAFAGIAWLRWSEAEHKRTFVFDFAVAGCTAVLLYAALIFYHSQAVPNAAGSAGALVHASANTMLSVGSPLYRIYILKAALEAPLRALLVLATPLCVPFMPLPRAGKIALAALWSEILILGIYHNTAPYFYVFLLAPVAVAWCAPLSLATRWIGPKVFATWFVLAACLLWSAEDRAIIDRQRTLVAAADTIFPTPVNYFDLCGMLGRDMKANIFMTPFGTQLYRAGAVPSMSETVQQKVVPLVVENDRMFTRVLGQGRNSPEILSEDAAMLRDTYVHFWGPFWVAGKTVAADAKQAPATIRVPGPYTVSGGAVEVDGRRVAPGGVIDLQRGTHRLSASDGKAARLVWGAHLRAPDGPPPPPPYWLHF